MGKIIAILVSTVLLLLVFMFFFGVMIANSAGTVSDFFKERVPRVSRHSQVQR